MGLLENLAGAGYSPPILYLPMKDAATAHINLGTGGDFTQQGLLETADRGANQDNCVASEFPINTDFLNTTAQITPSKSKQLTASFNIKLGSVAETPIDLQYTSGRSAFFIYWDAATLYLRSKEDATDTYVVWVDIPLSQMVDTSIQISFDVASTLTRAININGVPYSATWSTYVDGLIDFDLVVDTKLGSSDSSVPTQLGEVYIDTVYISDLSIFWDSDTNKPISVRKVIADNGLNPLIAMPLDASNITKNYGTGGDFTLNGVALGARGASEYISRSAKFDNATDNGYMLSNSGASGIVTKQLTIVFQFYCTTLANTPSRGVLMLADSVATEGNAIVYLNGVDTNLGVLNTYITSNGVEAFSLSDWAIDIVENSWHTALLSIDVASNTAYSVYDGVVTDRSSSILLNTDLDINGVQHLVGSNVATGANAMYGDVSSMYVSDKYIDFSQESNRNLFVNQLGYPRDLTPLIADGVIPNPLIYLPFDDTANLGKNLGTGGDFTVNGTVTAGADFAI